MDFYVGGFVRLRIFACSFTERCRVGGGVENVVGDLEGQAEMPADAAQAGELLVVRTAAQSAHHQCRAEHRAGLAVMNVF